MLKIKVEVTTRPNLRLDGNHQEDIDFLIWLFDEKGEKPTAKEKVLAYPERWLNTLEQRELFTLVKRRLPELEELTVRTHSVYIIQVAPNTSVFILDSPKMYPEIPLELDNPRFAPIACEYLSIITGITDL